MSTFIWKKVFSKMYVLCMSEWNFVVAVIRGNVYNWLFYGNVGNSVCRMRKSSILHILLRLRLNFTRLRKKRE